MYPKGSFKGLVFRTTGRVLELPISDPRFGIVDLGLPETPIALTLGLQGLIY